MPASVMGAEDGAQMLARVIYIDRERGVEEVAVGAHSLELSAFGGSWCHEHGSESCLDDLTAGELEALRDTEVLAFAS